MVTTFNLSLFSSLDGNGTHSGTDFLPNSSNVPNIDTFNILGLYITSTITLLFCLLGFWGNGLVIWLLGFRIKRNPFTTYILNLSIADFVVLTALAGINICWFLDQLYYVYGFLPQLVSHQLFLFTFSTSQFLLTAISIDRCICLFFPLWHRCHRPPHLSTIVCAIIWVISFFLSATIFVLFLNNNTDIRCYQFLMNALLFAPVMSVSTIAMLIKAFLMSAHSKQKKLVTAVLLSLLFFLLFAFPMNAVESLYFYGLGYDLSLNEYTYICASLNSTVNPIIYYLVGREKRSQSGERIKIILEKLFKEEENGGETLELSLHIKLCSA